MLIKEKAERAVSTSRPTKAACYLAVPALLLTTGCSSLIGSVAPVASVTPLDFGKSLSVGEWSGTTSQGMPIRFTVSSKETVTSLTVGYNFNGCRGTHTFEDISLPTAPNVTCIPGPCSATVASYRSFVYSDGSPATGGQGIQINGLFLPRGRAEGQIGFFNYPSCGTATQVTWTATRK